MQLYFSADPADFVSAIDIRAALDIILPGRLSYWDPSVPTATELRTAAKAYLEKADLFVLMYSPDYLQDVEKVWEMHAALAEKMRRPNQFYLLVVQTRFAVLPSELAPFEVLPAADEALEGPRRDAQIVRVAKAIAQLVTQQTTAPRAVPEGGLLGDMDSSLLTLADLRERLIERTDRANPSDAMALLKTLVTDAALLRRILQIEDDFISLHQHQRHSLAQYRQLAEAQQARMEAIILDIEAEDMLMPGWRSVFLQAYHRSPARTTQAFQLPLEDVVLPDTLNLPVSPQDVGSAERVGLLSYEQKLEFRRLLLLSRDALELGKYAAAYTYAEQVRTQIDPESAQLYEYLLLSFIKKEGTQAIMRRFVAGIPSGFRHIKLYSDRCLLYQDNYPPKCPSETVPHNCLVAAEELGAALNEAYSALPHHAITDTGARLDEQYKPALRQCIEAAFILHESLLPTKVMPETLILELLGAGKYSWLRRMEPGAEGFSFVGNGDFDLPGKISELLGMLEQADRRRSPEKQREMLREDLFWLLISACERLHLQVREEIRQKNRRTDLRQSLIHVIESCILGHYCLTQPGDVLEDEKSLLRLAVEILLPALTVPLNQFRLPASLHIEWFTLDRHGHLVTAPDCAKYSFDAGSIIERIVADHAGKSAWMVVAPNIKEEVWRRYVADTAPLHEAVVQGFQHSDFRRMQSLEARKSMVAWLSRLQVCAAAFPERSAPFTQEALSELCGDGLLMWFGINATHIYPQPDCAVYQFDPQRSLEHWLRQPGAWAEGQLSVVLVENLFNKDILPAYAAVAAGNESQRVRAADILASALLAFQKHPSVACLNLVYRELVEEIKFKWIEIAARGQWINISTDLDATGILTQLIRQLPAQFDPLTTRRQLADRRLNEQLRRYDKEISETRHENRLPERKIVAEIIWRLKAVFLFYPDLKYLELVRKELYDQGRIRWYERWLGAVKTQNASNHHENTLIPFDYKAERVELTLYEQDVSRLYGLMLEETISVSGT